MDKEINLGGRPTKYNPKFCDQIIEFVGKGYSISAFAGYIGVSLSVIYDWFKVHPEFKEARDIAKSKSLYIWESMYLTGLFEDKEGPQKVNTSLMIFGMKNHCQWVDRVEQRNQEIPPEIDIEKLKEFERDY